MLTTHQFQTLDDLYRYYNKKIFGGTLPECIVNLSRKPNSYGFFAANLWGMTEEADDEDEQSSEIKETVHEISLNPDYLMCPTKEWHSTFVHEMVHLWQQENGKPSRTAYHNREWADKMEQIGLMPTDTGAPGGKKTGQKVGHYIITGGLFDMAFQRLDPDELEELRLQYLPMVSLTASRKRKDDLPEDEGEGEGDGEAGENDDKKKKSGTRTKYSCSCGNNLWGRSGLLIRCLDCDEDYKEADM